MKKLTKAQRQKYVKEDGHFCPYCRSVKTHNVGCAFNGVIEIKCDGCGKVFEEIWKLVDVQDPEYTS